MGNRAWPYVALAALQMLRDDKGQELFTGDEDCATQILARLERWALDRCFAPSVKPAAKHELVIAMLRQVIDEWPGDRPAVIVTRDIEFHGEDAPRPDGDGWVPCGVAPERRQRITIEMTSGPMRISSWRKLTQEELDEISAFEDDDE